MLKITILDDQTEQRLVLEGRLTEPDISVLESAWDNALAARGTRRCIVDLRNATSLDASGERILLGMKREGAQFLACGVSIKHRLEELGIPCNRNGSKAPKVK